MTGVIPLKMEKVIDIKQSSRKLYLSVHPTNVYNHVCFPCVIYNADLKLQYRGRLDESRKETAPEGVRRDLFEAMKQVAQTGQGPKEQIPSMGCSIKWKA